MTDKIINYKWNQFKKKVNYFIKDHKTGVTLWAIALVIIIFIIWPRKPFNEAIFPAMRRVENYCNTDINSLNGYEYDRCVKILNYKEKCDELWDSGEGQCDADDAHEYYESLGFELPDLYLEDE